MYQPEDLENYLASAESLFAALNQAVSEHDYKTGVVVFEDLRELIHHFRVSLQQRYGRLRTKTLMGAFQLPPWKDKTAQEILNEFYPLIDFYIYLKDKLELRVSKELGAQKKATQKELRSLKNFLNALVRKARKMVIKRAPGWWTGKREREFRDFLPGDDV